MSTYPLPVLDYAGPIVKTRRGWGRIAFDVITGLLRTAWALLRLTLLLAGFTFIAIGGLLLIAGRKRSAARSVRALTARFADLLHLWRDDLRRPFRQWAAGRATL